MGYSIGDGVAGAGATVGSTGTGVGVVDGTDVVDDVDVRELLAGRVDDRDNPDVRLDEEGFEVEGVRPGLSVCCSLRSRFTVAAAAAPRDPPTSAMIKIAATSAPIIILPTFVLQNGTMGSEGKGLVPASSASFAGSVTGVMPVEDGCSI